MAGNGGTRPAAQIQTLVGEGVTHRGRPAN